MRKRSRRRQRHDRRQARLHKVRVPQKPRSQRKEYVFCESVCVPWKEWVFRESVRVCVSCKCVCFVKRVCESVRVSSKPRLWAKCSCQVLKAIKGCKEKSMSFVQVCRLVPRKVFFFRVMLRLCPYTLTPFTKVRITYESIHERHHRVLYISILAVFWISWSCVQYFVDACTPKECVSHVGVS